MPPDLKFKISSGLKNIIGKDLITDEFVAVFELVKNSYDAGARHVKIIFEDLRTDRAKIIIQDDGKGMDFKDINDKWLFVAHSAKKTGEEDDYRNKINIKRYYAGAKGIGRFSCDRLGERLKLSTLKLGLKPTVEVLYVNWRDFEKNSKVEFKDIPVKHSHSQSNLFPYASGTVLEISSLNDQWDREKLLSLKTSLSKLILPSINKSEMEERPFEIDVEAKDELIGDDYYKELATERGEEIDLKKIVNGSVYNFVFESLNLKTTQILAKVKGGVIITSLTDRGKFIYELVEKNTFDLVDDVQYNLFFLNQAAKANFTRIMGIQPINYGNVFIYKNGFRVLPYGNERDDYLGIDARHSQGFRRFLGTRNLIGRLEIFGENNDLRETSSRDGGLIKNSTYYQFVECFFKILRRLEKYVVDTKDWGVDDELLKDFDEELSKEQVVKLLSNLSSEKDIIRIRYNDDILEIINEQQQNSASRIVKNFKRIAAETNNPELLEKADTLEKKINVLVSAKNEAEAELKQKEKRFKNVEKQLKASNLYLLSTSREITGDGLALVHHIQHETSKLGPKVDILIRQIQRGNVNMDQVIEKLSEIKLHSDKVLKVSRLITRSNFNLLVNEQKADLVAYISEYIRLYDEINESEKILLRVEDDDLNFQYRFSPINISIIFDNLIGNSKKANASEVLLKFKKEKKGLQVIYSDNGVGINEDIVTTMYNIGVTTTNGSGIGLFTVKQMLNEMGGEIHFIGNNVVLKGAAFQLEF